MSNDLTFGVKLDASGNLAGEVKAAAGAMDDLAASTQKAASQADELNVSQKSTSLSIKQIAEAQMGMSIAESNALDKAWALSNGYQELNGSLVKNTASLVENAGAHGANSTAIRESLVLVREAARGNWTRMAGSASILTNALGLMPAILSPVGLGIIGVTAAVGGGIWAWEKYGETLEDIHAKLDSVADTGLQNMQDKITLQNQTLTNKVNVKSQTGLTGLSDAEANRMGVLNLQIEVYTTRLSHAKENTDEFASATRGLATAQDSYNKLAALLADRQSLQQQNKPASQKIDPVDTAYLAALKQFTNLSDAATGKTDGLTQAMIDLAKIQDSPMWQKYTEEQQNQLAVNALNADAAEKNQAAQQDLLKTNTSYNDSLKQFTDLSDTATGQTDGLTQAMIDLAKIQDSPVWQKYTEEQQNQLAVTALNADAAEKQKTASAELVKAQDDAAKKQSEAFKTASDSVNRTLTDALMRAFESGKGFGQAFIDTLVNMFKTMILQPTISAILAPVTGGMASMMTGNAGAQTMTNAQGIAMTTTGTEAAGAMTTMGWIGLAAVATAAIASRLGYDHGNKSAAEIQSVQATGEVFGDMQAKSATIAQVSQAIKLNSDDGLVYSKGMLDALTQMNNGIGNFAAMIVRTNPSLSTGQNFGLPEDLGTSALGNYLGQAQKAAIDTMTLGIGNILGLGGLGDSIGSAVSSFWSHKSQTITDTGLKISGTVGDLMQGNGIQQYMDSNTTTSHLGGLYKTTDANPTQYASVDSQFAQNFALIFSSLHDVMINAGTVLGKDVSGMDTLIKNFDISTQISLKGLSGQALSDAISQVITNMSDKIVQSMFSDVLQYAQVGEDALTTLVRVANETEMVSVALDRIGVAAKPAAADMMGVAESLIAQAGGAATYQSEMDFFSKNFLTTAQQLVPAQNAVNKTFADLNMAVPDSVAAFTALMQSADVSTASGQALQVALLNIAPAFNSIATAAADATTKLLALIKTDNFSTSLAYTMALANAMAPSSGSVPGFASGGDFGGGTRIVGENGPELESTGPSHITNNSDSKKLFDTSGLLSEIQALRAEVVRLRASNEDTARSSRKVSDLLRRVTQDGNSLLTTPA